MEYDEYYDEQPTPPMTGYAMHRGLMRLMMLFSCSFCATVLARIFPGVQPAMWIAAATGVFGLLAYVFIKRGDQSAQLVMVAIALLGGVVGGSWDAIKQMNFDSNAVIPAAALAVVMVGAIATERSFSRRARERNEF